MITYNFFLSSLMTFALQIGQGVTGETFSLLQIVCITMYRTVYCPVHFEQITMTEHNPSLFLQM